MKISFGGSAGGQYDKNQQVVVSQVGRMKDCLARDGKTRLLYGHVIRTTVLLNNYTVSTDVSLAIVAAQATIKSASNRVELEAIGVQDDEVQAKLQEAKDALGGSATLRVENFGDFNKKRAEAEAMAIKSARVGSERLGIVGELINEASTQSLLGRAFALQMIAQGRDCQQMIHNFKLKGAAIEAAIRSVYDQVAQGCSPDSVAKEKAKKLLGPVEIRQK